MNIADLKFEFVSDWGPVGSLNHLDFVGYPVYTKNLLHKGHNALISYENVNLTPNTGPWDLKNLLFSSPDEKNKLKEEIKKVFRVDLINDFFIPKGMKIEITEYNLDGSCECNIIGTNLYMRINPQDFNVVGMPNFKNFDHFLDVKIIG